MKIERGQDRVVTERLNFDSFIRRNEGNIDTTETTDTESGTNRSSFTLVSRILTMQIYSNGKCCNCTIL